MSHVSLKDVAAKAGVTFPTVSKVLKGKGTVSPETRIAILQAAEELRYIPNAVARSLANKKTSTIGCIVGDFCDVALSQIFVGVGREADRQGLSMVVSGVDPIGADSHRHLLRLLEQRIDGIILIAPHLEREAGIFDALHGRIPVVSTHWLADDTFSLVNTDDILTGFVPTQHLITSGHTRIATITGLSYRSLSHMRLLGYQQALASANIAYHPDLVEEGDWQIAGGYQATCRLLQRAPDLTAIYAQNDMMAVGALSALRDLGHRVPEDCAVVGCDDIPLSAHVFPALTTMHIPFSELGEASARLLRDLIVQDITAPQKILLPVHLVARNSSASTITT
jgi:LacI family transcriptional regulator